MSSMKDTQNAGVQKSIMSLMNGTKNAGTHNSNRSLMKDTQQTRKHVARVEQKHNRQEKHMCFAGGQNRAKYRALYVGPIGHVSALLFGPLIGSGRPRC